MRGIPFGKPGFANSLILRIGLLILLSLAAFAGGVYHLIGRPTVDRLADAQIQLASQQLEARFSRLLRTVETTLRSSQGWGKYGAVDQAELRRFNEFFFPIIANHGEIRSVILANQSGREIFLLMDKDGRWINRISNPAEWGNRTYWITWNRQRRIEKVDMRQLDYDARTRPWFKGAMALPDDSDIFWTEPYIFYTTREPGITAAMRWHGADGSTYVIGHDVNLTDIAEFTTRMAIGADGKAALFMKDGRLIAPPRDPRFASREALRQTLLKTPGELGLPELAEAFGLWRGAAPGARPLRGFDRPDGRWISLFKPIAGNHIGISLGIVAPERDFVPITPNDLLLLGLIALAALALGMAVAIRVSRQFGEPLMALADESSRIGSLDLDKPVATEARWREVVQLATALEGMRQHLQRSRRALEDANQDLEQKVARRTEALRQNQEILQRREAFFRAVFDNAAVGIVSLDPDGRPALVNPAFARFIKQPMDILLAHPESIVLPRPILDAMADLLSRADAESRRSVRGEFAFADGADETRWGDVQIAAVRSDGDRLDSILVTVLDVSDRRQVENELIRQFAFLEALLDTIPNPIFYKGADTRFLGCNTAYEQFFGIERSAFIGKRVLDLDYLPLEARRSYQAEDEEIIRKCGRSARKIPMPGADGTLHDTLYSVNGFRAPDGSPGGLIGVIVDITPLENAKRDAEAARANAEAAAAAKGDFLANMSHEIRTPMNAIIGMTQLALQTELTARQRNYLLKVDAAAVGLLGIINDILDLSKIEAGMMQFEHAPFSLDACMRQLSDLVALKASDKGLELLYDIASDVPDQLIGDSLRLRQVMLNLVGNAIKFTEAGEVKLVVKILASRGQTVELGFEVHDTGIGMSEEQLAGIFSAFTQADSSTTRKYGGTGLGLSICKRIVEGQGGAVDVASRPGAGSCFRFRLPFELGDGQPAGAPVGLPEQLRILVVDDSASACEIFVHTLAALHVDSRAVYGGPAALLELEAARQAGQAYGLVVIDWKMPGMDGIALLERIRGDDATGGPAIVMATANDLDQLRTALGDKRVDALLAKPATPSSLFDSLMTALHPEGTRPPRKIDAPANPAGNFAGHRVLLVEDNAVNRELAEEMLANMGLRVDIAENGERALDRIRETAYDLVLMDCQMPVMDGYTATRVIRNELNLPELPVIAMTANALAGDREKCLAAGMDDHLPKPISLPALQRMLADWLETEAPAAATTEAEPPAAGPGDAEALDVEAALARLGGNRGMYKRLLAGFRENQHDVADRLREDRARGDSGQMLLRAHTLRGLAGTIGAVGLGALAGQLEGRLRDGLPAGEPEIDELLDRLAAALPAALAIAGPSEPAAPPSAPLPPAEVQNENLSSLMQLLDNDDALAVGRLEDMAGWLRQAFDPHLVDRLARQIHRYDYDEAKNTLRQITGTPRST